MPRPSPYTAEQKTKIIEAAVAAKAAGDWNQALDAAKEAGFKGGLAYLKVMIRGTKKSKAGKSKKTKKPGRPKKATKSGAKRQRSEAEAAVRELQNAPATVTRDEALHATDAFKLVRKNKESGKVESRPRGRQHPEFEYGYINGDDEASFKAGDPPKKRGKKGRGGRPKGSKNKASVIVKRGPGRPAKSVNGLTEIESIVRREVDARLKAAKEAAIRAFTVALSV